MLKLGLSYAPKGFGSIGVYNSYYSKPFDTEGALESLGELKAFNWMTAKVQLNVSKIANIDYPNIGIDFEAINLLDKEVYNPDILFGQYNAVQNKPGAIFKIGATVTF